MSNPIGLLLAALGDPSDANIELLAACLNVDVHAVGPFVNGSNRDEVIAAIANPGLPVLAMATFAAPIGSDSAVTVRAEVPAGLPIVAVLLTVRQRDGQITEIIQEVEMPPPPPATAVELSDELAETINGAFDRAAPVVVAYVDADGRPHISYRGAVYVHSIDELAMWIRDPNGGLLRNIVHNEHVALMYRDSSRTMYEFAGRARRVDDASTRKAIYDAAPEFERGLDPIQRGQAVIVTIDSVRGGPHGKPINMQRNDG
jgi:Pyridoxamine 5'-phosphate oxidase